MATITERPRADGRTSFFIQASDGLAIDGKRKRPSLTWTPEPGWSDKRIQKELQIQVVRFEDAVNAGTSQDGNMKFQAFAEKWIAEYANKKLKKKTVMEYKKRLPLVYQAIGHKRLKDIKTGHLNSFYVSLEEPAARSDGRCKIKIDILPIMKEQRMTRVALAERAGLSIGVIKSTLKKNCISKKSATAISKALDKRLLDLFTMEEPDKTLSAGTIHTYHRLVSSVFSKAVKWGYIAFNPATNAELPCKDKKEAAFLDDKDVRRLLTLLRNEPIKWRIMVILDVLSGLRRGELLGLRWCDVDFNNEVITVVQTSAYVQGLGVIDDTVKTEKSERTMKLSRLAFSLLLDYKDWQDGQRDKCGDLWKENGGRVFTGDFGGLIHPDSLTKWFKKFIRKHDFPDDIHLHSLRHTAASLMIADGINIVTVSRRLGHAQVSTTSDIYAHMIRAADEKAAAVADKYAEELSAPLAEIIHINRAQ